MSKYFQFVVAAILILVGGVAPASETLTQVLEYEDIRLYQDNGEYSVVIQTISKEDITEISKVGLEEDFLQYFSLHSNEPKKILNINLPFVLSLVSYRLRSEDDLSATLLQATMKVSNTTYLLTSDLPIDHFTEFLNNFNNTQWRSVASKAVTEGANCSICEFSQGLRSRSNDLFKSAEEFWQVSCKATTGKELSLKGQIAGGVKSCLAGFELSMLDLVKFVRDISLFFLDFSSDKAYRSKIKASIGAVLLFAMKDPVGFAHQIYKTIMESLLSTFKKLKACSVEYQLNFACKVATDLVIGGVGVWKNISTAAKTVKNIKGPLKKFAAGMEKVADDRIPLKPSKTSVKAEFSESVLEKKGIVAQEIKAASAEIKPIKQLKILKQQSLKDPVLNKRMEKAERAMPAISKLPNSEAQRVLRIVDTFTPEERKVFQEEVVKPQWRWCR